MNLICPSEGEFRIFVEGRLTSERQLWELAHHLTNCTDCRRKVTRMFNDPNERRRADRRRMDRHQSGGHWFFAERRDADRRQGERRAGT